MVLAMMFIMWKAPSYTALIVGSTLYGFAYGGTLVLRPVLIGNYYGPEAFATINGVLSPIRLIFIAPTPLLAGYAADRFGNYDIAFIGLIIVIGLGAISAALAAPPRKKFELPAQ
jgi:MFS family permease